MPAEIRKQISIFVPLSDWKTLRREAARRRVPMTELCRRWINPQLQRLQRDPHGDGEPNSTSPATGPGASNPGPA